MPVSSVQVVALVEQYIFRLPALLPVLLNTVAASKLIVTALRLVKFRFRSNATDEVLSVVPVDKSWMLVFPFWMPPDVPMMKVAEGVVTAMAFGIVPALVVTDENEFVLGVVQAVKLSE